MSYQPHQNVNHYYKVSTDKCIQNYKVKLYFSSGGGTVPTTPVLKKPVLFTNWPKFTMLFYYIKVPPHFSPPGPTLVLTAALKWGIVWTSTSTGTGITKGQSWKHVFIK